MACHAKSNSLTFLPPNSVYTFVLYGEGWEMAERSRNTFDFLLFFYYLPLDRFFLTLFAIITYLCTIYLYIYTHMFFPSCTRIQKQYQRLAKLIRKCMKSVTWMKATIAEFWLDNNNSQSLNCDFVLFGINILNEHDRTRPESYLTISFKIIQFYLLLPID